MATSSAILRQPLRSRPFVPARRTRSRSVRIAPRANVDRRSPRDENARIVGEGQSENVVPFQPLDRESEDAASPGKVFASLTLVALTVAMAVTAFYGAQYVLSEIAQQSTMEMLRMFGGLP